jgi:RNA polymerase primary sigma factor
MGSFFMKFIAKISRIFGFGAQAEPERNRPSVNLTEVAPSLEQQSSSQSELLSEPVHLASAENGDIAAKARLVEPSNPESQNDDNENQEPITPSERRMLVEGTEDTLEQFLASSRLFAKDTNGDTPLHIAARAGNLGLCELFVRAGANPARLNNERQTPADVALIEKHRLVAQFLSSLLGEARQQEELEGHQVTPEAVRSAPMLGAADKVTISTSDGPVLGKKDLIALEEEPTAPWSDDRVQRLMVLWAEGKSPSQIAQELDDVSRIDVLSKLFHIGMLKKSRPHVDSPKDENICADFDDLAKPVEKPRDAESLPFPNADERRIQSIQDKPQSQRHADAFWNGERIEVLKRLWSEGQSASEIAREFGGVLTAGAVLFELHRLGIHDRPKGLRGSHASWSDERVQRLKALWAEGESAGEIARELGGVSRNAVLGKLSRLGLLNKPRPDVGPSEEEKIHVDRGDLANPSEKNRHAESRPLSRADEQNSLNKNGETASRFNGGMLMHRPEGFERQLPTQEEYREVRTSKQGLVDEANRPIDQSIYEERSGATQDYVVLPAATEETTPGATVKEQTIEALIAGSKCSVRLRNAIAKAGELPVATVIEYMSAPDQSREAFKKLPNIGKKSADELHELVTEFFRSAGAADGKGQLNVGAQSGTKIDDKSQRAHTVARRMIDGLQFPDDIISQFPSVRLKNSLMKAYAEQSISFAEFFNQNKEEMKKLRIQGGFGAKLSEELERLITDAISKRLSAHRIGNSLSSSIRDILIGREIDYESLCSILAYEDVDILPPLKEEISMEWGAKVGEIVANLMNYLTDREHEVLKRRYALDGGEVETLEEIAKDHEVTRERIRQIEAKTLRKFRNNRIVNALSVALDSEDAIEVVFKNRRLVTEDQIASIFKTLDPPLRLAIDICYNGLKGFLERESVKTDSGWTLEQYLLELLEEPDLAVGSLRQRLVDAILKETLPIRVSAIADKLPDLTLKELHQELRSSFSAVIDGDELRAAPRLPASVRYILILRKEAHALHCKEIRALNHEIFGKDESIQQIGSILGGLDEALIVARGTYNLYENLRLNSDDLRGIRDIAHDCLEAREEYVSVKVLFSELFQGSTEKFGADFDYYMLLGILQDDERFDVRRGLMVGLFRFSSSLGFLGLNEEIISVLSDSSRAMSLQEIAAALEGRRDTLLTSIATSLENSRLAVSVSRGHYELTSRIFGDERHQLRLHDCCCIVLSSGPKTVLALAELISPIVGDYPTRPLKGFLAGFDAFRVEADFIYLRQAPLEISRYIEARDAVLGKIEKWGDDLARVRDFLASQGLGDLVDLDPTLAGSAEVAGTGGDDEELLDKLLGDFGIQK